MQPGKLDRRITIESFSESRDAYGASIESWNTLATVWANVQQQGGRELLRADQIAAQVDAIFTIRWRTDVTTKMRLSYDGKIWDIVKVTEIGRKKNLELAATVHSGA